MFYTWWCMHPATTWGVFGPKFGPFFFSKDLLLFVIGPQANILCSLPQSAQAFGCGLSAFPICIHSLSFCSSLAGSLPGFYPASKRLYLTFLSLVFVFDCQLTSFLNVKTVYCLERQCTPYLINIMFNGAQVDTFSRRKPRGWGTPLSLCFLRPMLQQHYV